MKEKLQKEIIQATKELIYEGCNAADITMEHIADRLEMTAPTLYHYFKSKDDIISLAYRMIADDLLGLFEKSLPSSMSTEMQLKTRLVSLIRYFGDNPTAFPLIFTKGSGVEYNAKMVNRKLTTFMRSLQGTVHSWVRSKRRRISGVKATYFLLSIIMGHLFYLRSNNTEVNVEEAVEEVFELFSRSVY